MRCLTLARALKRSGARIVLLSQSLPSALRDRVSGYGIPVAELHATGPDGDAGVWPEDRQLGDAASAVSALESHRAAWIIVDHYGLDSTWEARVRRAGVSIAAIDDLANREHDVDLLIDQNWFGPGTATRYNGLLSTGTRRLLGPRYALLQPEYRQQRARPAPVDDVARLLVSFGGSDPTDETTKALRGLLPLLHRGRVELDLVVGGAARNHRRVDDLVTGTPGIRVHRDLPSLAPLMRKCRLAVGAGGATTWERVCLQLPALVTAVAENQITSSAALDDAGVIQWLGESKDTSPGVYREAVAAVLDGDLPLPPPLVDGWGAERVASTILGHPDRSIRIRDATAADAPMFVGPDASQGRKSYLHGPEVWDENLSLLWDNLNRAGDHPSVLELGGVPSAVRWTSLGTSSTVWVDDAVVSSLRNGLADALRQDPS